MSGQRLQKLIAAAGLTSRRKAEGLIAEGRVRLNGEVVTELGTRADPAVDRIEVDGQELIEPEPIYLALHKPPGVITSVSDPHAARVVIDLLGPEIAARVFPAGRLDLDSEGLVLLTNDGELMHAMTRPGSAVEKVYAVQVEGHPADEDLDRLRKGMSLGGRRLLPCEVEPTEAGELSRLRVVLHEGKKNQIRRMFRTIGHPVRRLVRTRIGPVRLDDLGPEQYRELSAQELGLLRQQAGLETGGDVSVLRVAIDGPSGAGKSTLARAVAAELRLPYVDTGAMYRAVAWSAMAAKAESIDQVEAMLADLDLQVVPDPAAFRVLVDGHDVTEHLREPAVSKRASEVAQIVPVREWLVAKQRELAADGAVLEGRDIGTVVLPDAEVKLFITASEEVRLQRRAAQLTTATAEDIVADVRDRDRRDRQRKASPLRAAGDAFVVDTGDETAEASLARILAEIARHTGAESFDSSQDSP